MVRTADPTRLMLACARGDRRASFGRVGGLDVRAVIDVHGSRAVVVDGALLLRGGGRLIASGAERELLGILVRWVWVSCYSPPSTGLHATEKGAPCTSD